MNVKTVYFPVEIELFLNLEIWVEFNRTFLVAACTCWFGMLGFEEFGRNLEFSPILAHPCSLPVKPCHNLNPLWCIQWLVTISI